jgi:hypothetical protein
MNVDAWAEVRGCGKAATARTTYILRINVVVEMGMERERK